MIRVIESIRKSQAKSLELDGIKSFEDSGLNSYLSDHFSKNATPFSISLAEIKYLSATEREAASQSIADQCGADLPDNLMMTTEQIIDMQRAGMLIGAHTVTHPILAKLGSYRCSQGNLR